MAGGYFSEEGGKVQEKFLKKGKKKAGSVRATGEGEPVSRRHRPLSWPGIDNRFRERGGNPFAVVPDQGLRLKANR